MKRVTGWMVTKGARVGGGILPIDIDFSALADGALPAPLVGATWAISSGVAVNTPTLGTEMLTDTGLEATYTAGLCDSLNKGGSPTLSESSDVHGGSKAQQYIGTSSLDSIYYKQVSAPSAGTWYTFSSWGKRSVGSAGGNYRWLFQSGMLPAADVRGNSVDSAGYTQSRISGLSVTTNGFTCYPVRDGRTGDTVIVDDGSLKPIITSSLHTLANAGTVNINAKVVLDTPTDATLLGIILRADADPPTNAIYVYAYQQPHIANRWIFGAIKRIGSTYAAILAPTQIIPVADAWFEARVNGATLAILYNGLQVGSDITLTDAELMTGKQVGMFSTGNNGVKRFFVEAG